MQVELLHATPLNIAITAMRRCWRSEDKSDTVKCPCDSRHVILGVSDKKLIRRIINKGHTSTVEHLNYTFDIQGISRALLQELARHRIASLSVESTRYTLKRLVQEAGDPKDMLVQTGVPEVDAYALAQLESLIELVCREDIPNDRLKFMLPEAYKTNLIWTINARSLTNFLRLRLDPAAMWEMRALARAVVEQIPTDHHVLFEQVVPEFQTSEEGK